jgi:D-xylose reductase
MIIKQNEAWGLEYIDLLLIHFPCALEYIDPERGPRYPVSADLNSRYRNAS